MVSEENQSNPTKQKTVLETSDMDPKFKYKISKIPGAEKIMLCFQCGTCTADCPIARFSDTYRPRKLMRMTQLGMKDKVLSSDVIWLCTACFTCIDHCPQGVEIANVLRALRNLAVKEGFMPVVFKELVSNIRKTGYAYIIPQSRLQKRKDIGLPPLPKGNLEDISKLFSITDLSKMLEEEEK